MSYSRCKQVYWTNRSQLIVCQSLWPPQWAIDHEIKLFPPKNHIGKKCFEKFFRPKIPWIIPLLSPKNVPVGQIAFELSQFKFFPQNVIKSAKKKTKNKAQLRPKLYKLALLIMNITYPKQVFCVSASSWFISVRLARVCIFCHRKILQKKSNQSKVCFLSSSL